MKNTISILIFALILHSCNSKPKEQIATSSEDETTEYSSTVYDSEIKDAVEEAAVEKSVAFNYTLFDLIEKQTEKNLKTKGGITILDLNADDFDNEISENSLPFITYDTLQHKKVNGQFTLYFQNGDSLAFFDIPEKYGDALTTYNYIGFLDNLKAYIIEVMFWEDYIYLLIDQQNGSISTIDSVPLFDQQGTTMVTYDDSPYDECTIYQVYRLRNGKLVPIHRLVTDHHYTDFFYWKDKTTLNIKTTKAVNDSIVYHQLKIDQ